MISDELHDVIRREVAGFIAIFGLLALIFFAGFALGLIVGKLL